MGAKRGDWRLADVYYQSAIQAEEARAALLDRHPELRTRVRHYSTLGYALQVWVERRSAGLK